MKGKSMKIQASVFALLAICSVMFLSACSSPEESSTEQHAPQSTTNNPKKSNGSIVRSQICLSELLIQQYHIHQPPQSYPGHGLSTVSLYYSTHETGEIFLDKVEVSLKNGDIRTHIPVKGMSVVLGVNGVAKDAVQIIQYFPSSS